MALWLWVIVAVAPALVALGLGGWWLARGLDGEARALAKRIGRLPWRAKARLAWALLRDQRVPVWLRAVIPALVLYLALPIDIIPDFIPVLGHLDDVLVVLLAVGALVRFTPRQVFQEHLATLEKPVG
jgi:uncharacterized membrane protein YkvA (DUF1232 family)